MRHLTDCERDILREHEADAAPVADVDGDAVCWWCEKPFACDPDAILAGRFCSDACDVAWCKWSEGDRSVVEPDDDGSHGCDEIPF